MIDFEALARVIFDGAVRALGEGASLVEARAKARAPVRNIFSGVRYRFRPKTIGEMEADRAAGFVGSAQTWRHELYAPTMRAGRVTSAHDRMWRQRRPLEAEFFLNAYKDEMAARKAGRASGRQPEPTRLSRRGAYEVKIALASDFNRDRFKQRNPRAANWSQWGQSFVGGRLRGEIYSTRPAVNGEFAEAWVISPTDYAKYQEFGTRHNRAHPFLRPALAESRKEIVSRIAAAVKEASRTGAAGTEIEIQVRL